MLFTYYFNCLNLYFPCYISFISFFENINYSIPKFREIIALKFF